MNWLPPLNALRHTGPIIALSLLAACSGEPEDMRAWLAERVGKDVQCTIIGAEAPPFLRIKHVGDDYLIAAPIWTVADSKDTLEHMQGMMIPFGSISKCTTFVASSPPNP